MDTNGGLHQQRREDINMAIICLDVKFDPLVGQILARFASLVCMDSHLLMAQV